PSARYPLSLHDALPIYQLAGLKCWQLGSSAEEGAFELEVFCGQLEAEVTTIYAAVPAINNAQTFYLEGGFGIGSTKRTEFPYLRSEEHTSELQSPYDLV